MKKSLFKIILFTLVFMITIEIATFASTLTLTLSTDKKQYETGDKIIVTVDWTEKMQAAGFKIKYDADKIEFVSANITDTFYNVETAGEISINWASMEETELTKMTFELKATKAGEAKIFIQSVDDFADKNLSRPTSYDYTTAGSQMITISDKSSNGNKAENEQPNVVSNEKDNTLANKTIPNTGMERTITLLIITITILAIIGFIKYKSIPKI
ncbi:MAG: cohesin domain-containing protein [Clostridia bacterium]